MQNRTLLVMATACMLVGVCAGNVAALCGDGVVDADEDCDLGGTCIGGLAAGTVCHVGDATCTGGTCTTFGGQGCASNCTSEHDVSVSLIAGVVSGPAVVPGTSGVTIIGDLLSIPLPLGGTCVGGTNIGSPCGDDLDCPDSLCMRSHEILTVGKRRDGKIPVVIRVEHLHDCYDCPLPELRVRTRDARNATEVCGCVHRIEAMTCGGTFFEPDGVTLSTNCTPGFSANDACAGKAPCTFVYGGGNTASGEIGCDGLEGANVLTEQDAGGPNGSPGPVLFHLSGHGGPGSAVIRQTLGVTAILGACSGYDPATYGPDGVYCTADDPYRNGFSGVGMSLAVTGTATAVLHNANRMSGEDLGPVSASGTPFTCDYLECGDQSAAAGAGLTTAFPVVSAEPGVDTVAVAQSFFAGLPPDSSECVMPFCEGDCDGSNDVTIDELMTLVNIALGNAESSTCPYGIPGGSDVDIAFVVGAVGHALVGTC